jgi:hypothetical protein
MNNITRWDFSKSRSSYHFDPTIVEDDNLPFSIVGRVECDLVKHLSAALAANSPKPNGFLNRLSVQNDRTHAPFTADMDRAELDHLGLAEDHTFFDNLKPLPQTLEALRKAFGFKPEGFGGGFHIQRSGQMFPYHVDEIPNIKGNQINHWIDKQPEAVARFEIQVYDWRPGQVWAYGNTYWDHWKTGDIAWHNWRDIPHGTCNLSDHDRVTLQVTGFTTDKTLDIITKGNLRVSM